jgi:hypothetical protein
LTETAKMGVRLLRSRVGAPSLSAPEEASNGQRLWWRCDAVNRSADARPGRPAAGPPMRAIAGARRALTMAAVRPPKHLNSRGCCSQRWKISLGLRGAPRARRACFSFRYRCHAALPRVGTRAPRTFSYPKGLLTVTARHVTALSVTGQISRHHWAFSHRYLAVHARSVLARAAVPIRRGSSRVLRAESGTYRPMNLPLRSNADLSDEGGASGGGASGGGASGDGGDGGGREGVAATSPVSRSVSTCHADRELLAAVLLSTVPVSSGSHTM